MRFNGTSIFPSIKYFDIFTKKCTARYVVSKSTVQSHQAHQIHSACCLHTRPNDQMLAVQYQAFIQWRFYCCCVKTFLYVVDEAICVCMWNGVTVSRRESASMSRCSTPDRSLREKISKTNSVFKKAILQTAALQSSQFLHVDLISILWVSLHDWGLPMCDFIKFASYK